MAHIVSKRTVVQLYNRYPLPIKIGRELVIYRIIKPRRYPFLPPVSTPNCVRTARSSG
jgi:hypothetical protein